MQYRLFSPLMSEEFRGMSEEKWMKKDKKDERGQKNAQKYKKGRKRRKEHLVVVGVYTLSSKNFKSSNLEIMTKCFDEWDLFRIIEVIYD